MLLQTSMLPPTLANSGGKGLSLSSFLSMRLLLLRLMSPSFFSSKSSSSSSLSDPPEKSLKEHNRKIAFFHIETWLNWITYYNPINFLAMCCHPEFPLSCHHRYSSLVFAHVYPFLKFGRCLPVAKVQKNLMFQFFLQNNLFG